VLYLQLTAVILSLIVAVIVVYNQVQNWLRKRRVQEPPDVEAYTVIKPQHDDAKETKHLIVPRGRQIYLLIGVKALDDRVYPSPYIWIYFPEGFKIDYGVRTRKLYFGKRLIPSKENHARLVLNSPLRKGAVGAIAIPIVVQVPNKLGEYEVRVEFASRGTDAPSRTSTFTIEAAESDFSHDDSYFDWKNYTAYESQ